MTGHTPQSHGAQALQNELTETYKRGYRDGWIDAIKSNPLNCSSPRTGVATPGGANEGGHSLAPVLNDDDEDKVEGKQDGTSSSTPSDDHSRQEAKKVDTSDMPSEVKMNNQTLSLDTILNTFRSRIEQLNMDKNLEYRRYNKIVVQAKDDAKAQIVQLIREIIGDEEVAHKGDDSSHFRYVDGMNWHRELCIDRAAERGVEL